MRIAFRMQVNPGVEGDNSRHNRWPELNAQSLKVYPCAIAIRT